VAARYRALESDGGGVWRPLLLGGHFGRVEPKPLAGLTCTADREETLVAARFSSATAVFAATSL
jgi:hypothetical protein